LFSKFIIESAEYGDDDDDDDDKNDGYDDLLVHPKKIL
jgi:hypothetical protein